MRKPFLSALRRLPTAWFMLSAFLFFIAHQTHLSAHLVVAGHIWSPGVDHGLVAAHVHGPSARRGVFAHRHELEDRGVLEISVEGAHVAPRDSGGRHAHRSRGEHRPHAGSDHLKDLLPVGAASPLPSVAAAETTQLAFRDSQPPPHGGESVEACARAPPPAV